MINSDALDLNEKYCVELLVRAVQRGALPDDCARAAAGIHLRDRTSRAEALLRVLRRLSTMYARAPILHMKGGACPEYHELSASPHCPVPLVQCRPCTRSLLESTGIGVSVGKLRKHPDWEVQSLAQRLVDVWKKQLAEHKKQAKAASSSSSSGAAAGSRFGGNGRR